MVIFALCMACLFTLPSAVLGSNVREASHDSMPTMLSTRGGHVIIDLNICCIADVPHCSVPNLEMIVYLLYNSSIQKH
jgi:hypothetical protein